MLQALINLNKKSKQFKLWSLNKFKNSKIQDI